MLARDILCTSSHKAEAFVLHSLPCRPHQLPSAHLCHLHTTSVTPLLVVLRHVLVRRLRFTFAALMDTTAFAISAVVVAAISGAFTFLNVYHYHPWSAHHWLVNALLLFYALFIAVFIVVALSTYFLLRPQPIIALRLLLEFTLLNGQSSQVRTRPQSKSPTNRNKLYVLTRVLKKFYRLATFFIVTAAFFIQTVGFGLWNSARSNHARIVYSVGTALFQLILAVLACYHQILLSRVSRQCGLHGKVARRKFIFASGTFVTGAGCVVAFAFVFEAEAFFLASNFCRQFCQSTNPSRLLIPHNVS